MSTKNLFSVLVFCLLLAGGPAVWADAGQPGGGRGGPPGGGGQGPRGGGQPPTLPDSTQIEQIVEEMAEALSLTTDQKERITDLHFAHFADAEELRGQAAGDRERLRREMDDLRSDFEEILRAVLNDEQKAKFEEMAKSRKPPSGQNGQRRN